jgi:Icc-related predicted phosphoesterase
VSAVSSQWDELILPAGDLLVVAGDLCERSDESFRAANEWVRDMGDRFPWILYVPGNHDARIVSERRKFEKAAPNLHQALLIDRTTEIGGLKIHGMPWNFGERGDSESLIPAGLDLLVTHEPPYGILDWSPRSGDDRLGNVALLKRVKKVAPRVHVFGHHHMARGHVEIAGTHCVNVAVCGRPKHYYGFANPATVIDIDGDSITVNQNSGR